jgi:hypothetical protein
MQTPIFKAHAVIAEYDNSPELQSEYGSLYFYCLYLCGGDFNLFDDTSALREAIEGLPDPPEYLEQ